MIENTENSWKNVENSWKNVENSWKIFKMINVFINEDERREKSTWENYSKSLQSRKELKIQHKTSWHTKKVNLSFYNSLSLLSSKSLCCQNNMVERIFFFGKFYDLSANSSFVFLANDVVTWDFALPPTICGFTILSGKMFAKRQTWKTNHTWHYNLQVLLLCR